MLVYHGTQGSRKKSGKLILSHTAKRGWSRHDVRKSRSTNTNGNVATHLIDRPWSSKGVFVILLEAEIAKATKMYNIIHGFLLSAQGKLLYLISRFFSLEPFWNVFKDLYGDSKPPLTWYLSTRLQTKITWGRLVEHWSPEIWYHRSVLSSGNLCISKVPKWSDCTTSPELKIMHWFKSNAILSIRHWVEGQNILLFIHSPFVNMEREAHSLFQRENTSVSAVWMGAKGLVVFGMLEVAPGAHKL